MLKQASQINRVKGIELVGTWDIDETNVRETKQKLDDLGLNCVSIIPDLFSQKKWGNEGKFLVVGSNRWHQSNYEELALTWNVSQRYLLVQSFSMNYMKLYSQIDVATSCISL